MNVAACHNAFVLALAVATLAFATVRSHDGGAPGAGASESRPVAAFAWSESGDTSVPSALAAFAAHSASDETVSATF